MAPDLQSRGNPVDIRLGGLYRNQSGIVVRLRKIRNLKASDLERVDETSGYFTNRGNRINAFGRKMGVGWAPKWVVVGNPTVSDGMRAMEVDVKWAMEHPEEVIRVASTQSSRCYANIKAGNVLVEVTEP